MQSKLAVLVLLFAQSSSHAEAQRIYVNAAATGTNDGSSWENAFVDLRVALETTSAAEVWVARGVYRPSDAADGFQTGRSFHVSGRVVRGGFAGMETEESQRDPIANPTILSGDLRGDDGPGFENTADNSQSVVSLGSIRQTQNSALDGFAIIGATFSAASFACFECDAPAEYELRNCWIVQNAGYAAFVRNGNARLVNCVIQRNGELSGVPAVNAYCVYFDSGYNNSAAELLFCTIIDNPFGATLGGNRSNGAGPHGPPPMYCHGDVIISHSILRGNGPPESALGGDRTVARFSNIEGGFGIEPTIIDDDPKFVDRDGPDNTPGTLDDDLRLAADSTSLDAGDISAGAVTTDLAGGPRLLNCRADLGAFEATWFRDCDANGAADECELIERRGEVDADGDGQIDACEPEQPGGSDNGNSNSDSNNESPGGGDDGGDAGEGGGAGANPATLARQALCGGLATVLTIVLLVGFVRARRDRAGRR